MSGVKEEALKLIDSLPEGTSFRGRHLPVLRSEGRLRREGRLPAGVASSLIKM